MVRHVWAKKNMEWVAMASIKKKCEFWMYGVLLARVRSSFVSLQCVALKNTRDIFCKRSTRNGWCWRQTHNSGLSKATIPCRQIVSHVKKASVWHANFYTNG